MLKTETPAIEQAVKAIKENAKTLGNEIKQSEDSSLLILGRIEYEDAVRNIEGLIGSPTAIAVSLTEAMLRNEKIALIVNLANSAYKIYKIKSNDNEEED